MDDRRIPVVDFADYRSNGAAKPRFIGTLGAGLERFGFVSVRGHGIDATLLERAYATAHRAFALPLDVKRRYETPHDGRQRGYTSYGVEHARDQDQPDLKEFWHVGRELGPQHPLHLDGDVPPNQFPREVPEFGPVFRELFAAMDRFANALLAAVGDYLGVPDGYFTSMVRDGNSVLRIIHYPDIGPAPVPGSVRAAQHEDINLITVLPASTRPGLQLLTRDGDWIPVQAPPGVMVCDTGDMMARITNNVLPATTHRVVNPPGGRDGGRLSMPFFLHPHPDQVLQPLYSGGAAPIKARDFLHQRLEEIGVA